MDEKIKNYYNYDNIIDKLQNDKILKNIFPQYKQKIIECIQKKENFDNFCYELIKNIPNDFLNELEEKRKNQNELFQILGINDQNYNNLYLINESKYTSQNTSQDENKLKYYGDDNEIINNDLVNYWNELESKQLFSSLRFKKIQCFLGENKVFIIFNENLINIGNLENNIFIIDLLIYYYDQGDLKKFINYIQEYTFYQYIQNYQNLENQIVNENRQIIGTIYKIKETKENLQKEQLLVKQQKIIIPKINENLHKFIKLYIHYQRIIKEINSPLNNNTQIKQGYIIKNDFIIQNNKIESYQIISHYMSNNQNIKKLLNTCSNDSKEIFFQKILNEFDKNSIDEINEFKGNNYIYTRDSNAEIFKIKINENNSLYYLNNFFI